MTAEEIRLGLIERREGAGLTLREAAKEIGLNHGTLSRVENGKKFMFETGKAIELWLTGEVEPTRKQVWPCAGQ